MREKIGDVMTFESVLQFVDALGTAIEHDLIRLSIFREPVVVPKPAVRNPDAMVFVIMFAIADVESRLPEHILSGGECNEAEARNNCSPWWLHDPKAYSGSAKSIFPLPQDRHQHSIGSTIEHTNNRFTSPDRNPERSPKKRDRDVTVLPAVQAPLTMPDPDRRLAERAEVIDRPEIVSSRSARTKQIAEQMQMKHCESQQKHAPALNSEKAERSRNQNRAENSVEQPMMVALVESCGMSKRFAGDVHEKSQSIRIGKNSCQRYKSAIARMLRRLGRDQPTGEQMCFGRQVF